MEVDAAGSKKYVLEEQKKKVFTPDWEPKGDLPFWQLGFNVEKRLFD